MSTSSWSSRLFSGPEHVAFVALARDGQLGDELLLGHREPPGREGLGAEAVELLLDEGDAAPGVVVVRTEVDRHDARVGVGRVAGLDVVRQPVFLAYDGVEQRVGARSPEDVRHEGQRQAVLVADGAGAVADDAVRLVGMPRDLLGERGRIGGCRAAESALRGLLGGEVAPGYRFGRAGRDVADRREDHAVGRVRACREGADRVAVVAGEGRLAPQDVVPELRPGEEQVLERVVDHVGRRVLVGVDLVGDDLLLALELALGEGRAEGDVGDQLRGALRSRPGASWRGSSCPPSW